MSACCSVLEKPDAADVVRDRILQRLCFQEHCLHEGFDAVQRALSADAQQQNTRRRRMPWAVCGEIRAVIIGATTPASGKSRTFLPRADPGWSKVRVGMEASGPEGWFGASTGETSSCGLAMPPKSQPSEYESKRRIGNMRSIAEADAER